MKIPEPRKLKSGNYFIQLRLNGTSVPITASTARECSRQAALIKAEHAAGKREITKEGGITLTAAIDKYIAARSNTLSPSTIRGYRIIQKNRFASVSDTPLRKIDWQKVCNEEAALCSPKTLKNAYMFVRSVLKENGITAPDVTLPSPIPNERPWLDPEQVKVFVEGIKGDPCEIHALLALHGFRASEVLAILMNDGVDLKNGTITVRGAVVDDENNVPQYKFSNKNASSARTVPIMIPALEAAFERLNGEAPQTITSRNLYKKINKCCKRLGLPEVGVHGLRHSFASLAVHAGLSQKETMSLGGWSDPQTMNKIYTHISEKDKSAAANKISNLFAPKEEQAR